MAVRVCLLGRQRYHRRFVAVMVLRALVVELERLVGRGARNIQSVLCSLQLQNGLSERVVQRVALGDSQVRAGRVARGSEPATTASSAIAKSGRAFPPPRCPPNPPWPPGPA